MDRERLPKNLRKIFQVKTKRQFAEEVFCRLKRIIRRTTFGEKMNPKPTLTKPINLQASVLTRLMTFEAIKMHEVMERSMEVAEVTGVHEIDKTQGRKATLRTLLLSMLTHKDKKNYQSTSCGPPTVPPAP